MRRRFVMLFVAVLVCWLPAGAASAALQSWQVTATLSLGVDHVGVDCPTATACWSLESGRLLSSFDGGQTWADRTSLVPAGVSSLSALDCTSAARCFIAATDESGSALLLLLAQGAVTSQPVPATDEVTTLSCPATHRCVLITDTMSFVTTDDGATWSHALLGRTLLGRTAVTCIPGSQVCVAVGNYGLVPTILRSETSGRSWTMQTAPYGDGGIYAVACPSTTTCYATGADTNDDAVIVRTVDSGAHWTFAQVPFQSYAPRSVSCAALTVCTAVGHAPGETTYVFATTNGQQWTRQTVDQVATAQPAQVSCPTTTACAAVASAAAFVSTDGSTWQSVEVPAGLQAPASLACATRLSCVGVGADAAHRPFVITSGDGGVTWTAGSLPDGTGAMGDVACPTRTTCFASATMTNAKNQPATQLLGSLDGGATWQLLASRAGYVGALTCPGPTTCLASGSDTHGLARVLRTTDGRHWSALTLPVSRLSAVACGSLTSCVFLSGDPSGDAWTSLTSDDLGTSFQSHVVPAYDWYAMDCSGLFCMIGGSNGGEGAIASSTDGGVTWATPVVPRAAQLIDRVSCGSSSSCAAATYDFTFGTGGPRIVGTTDAGQTWHIHAVPARNESAIGLTCTGPNCVGSDYSPAGAPIIVSGRA